MIFDWGGNVMDPVKRGGQETSNSELMCAEEEGRKVESGRTGLNGKSLTLEWQVEENG